MLIEVITHIILDVENDDMAEEACAALSTGLDGALRDSQFPHGEVIDSEVDHYEKISDEEAKEQGWTE